MATKKLIEVALPLEAINRESAREKSIRHGHPSTLHLWWARRPLAAARAVIWSSLVDDPSSHPEQFPTEEEQNAERERLFRILEKLVVWRNSNNSDVLDEAKAEIMKSTSGNLPALLDPFAGGGSIPLEAQRLGLEAHAHDLNPVAVMINKAMIEIPPKFAGQPPVHPGVTGLEAGWRGAAGLAEDVRYYGKWMKQEAFKRIGHLYPKVKDEEGKEHTIIAWIWARTVKCPNPACACEIPLVRSFTLSRKKGKTVWIEPIYKDRELSFKVHNGGTATLEGTVSRKGAVCPCCGTPVEFPYIRTESRAKRMGTRMTAVVALGNRQRLYFSPRKEDSDIALSANYNNPPKGELGYYPGYINPVGYGITNFEMMFTARQMAALTTFRDLIPEVRQKVTENVYGICSDKQKSNEYGNAVSLYLSFAVDRLANRLSNICIWSSAREEIEQTFGMQGMQMAWDFAEANVFDKSFQV